MIHSERRDKNTELLRFNNLHRIDSTISEELCSTILKFFDLPGARIIIDFSGISYIDSSGFGVLLKAFKAARNNYGSIKLCSIKPGLMQLFITLHLQTLFEIYDNPELSIASF